MDANRTLVLFGGVTVLGAITLGWTMPSCEVCSPPPTISGQLVPLCRKLEELHTRVTDLLQTKPSRVVKVVDTCHFGIG